MAALFLCAKGLMAAAGGQLIYDGYLPIPNAASYSSTFSVRADGIDWASAQVVVTTVTQANQTFTDGSASTATVTVVSFAALSTAAATGLTVTIANNAATANMAVSGGGPNLGSFNVSNPAQWGTGAVSSNTACNLAAAINTAFGVGFSTCNVSGSAAGIVYATAPYAGAVWNTFTVNSSSEGPGSYMPVTQFSGGQNAATVVVNGVTFTAFGSTSSLAFSPVTSNGQTATNIAAVLATNAALTGVTAGAGGAVVFATATVVGTAGNAYTVTTSTDGALEAFGGTGSTIDTCDALNNVCTAAMSNGTNAAYTINTSTIALPGNTFGSGEGVFLSTGSNVGISPLIWGTTYYVITIPPNAVGGSSSIELATTQANALANVPIVLTSSQTKTTADTFTLNAPGIAGTPTVTWVASNDNAHWLPYTLTPFNVAIPSVTYATYYSSGSVNNFDFGHYNYSYIGLSVNAPTAGAINVGAHLVGNAP